MALGAVILAPHALVAQAAVSGQVTLLEKPGATSTDLDNAVIYLLPAKPPKGKLKTTKVTITMHDREFAPPVTVITVGSTVRFENQDPFDHNAFSNPPKHGNFDFGLADRGSTVQQKLKHSGIYPVFCNIHSKMAAFVVVVPTSYFTLAGSDGRFSIGRVPAGKYTLVAWHQRGGELKKALAVDSTGVATVAVELDARGYRPKGHKNKYGEDYTSESGDRY
jgi:plastocyanin